MFLAGRGGSRAPDGWSDDFAAAQALAADTGRDLLLDFTGSDWCPPCIALSQEVFDTPVFREKAPQHFVLVKVDFPKQTSQSERVKIQNDQLSRRYFVKSFPTVVLADAQGRPYATTTYRWGGPEVYLTHLKDLRAVRETRDRAFARARAAEGREKAKALDEALDAVGLTTAARHHLPEMQAIVELDADNAAGLRGKYHTALVAALMQADLEEATALIGSGRLQEGLARIDQVIAEHRPEGELLQMLTTIKAQVHLQRKDSVKARELLNEAAAIAPDSAIVPQIQAMIQRIGAQPALAGESE